MIPNIEKIAGDYLRGHPDVAALGARVVGKPPSQTESPWVQLRQLDASDAPTSRAEHLINYLLQADCYAGKEGGQPEAVLLARTVRAALHAMPGVRDGVVITSARFTGMARIPDTDFESARERVVLTATIHAHKT